MCPVSLSTAVSIFIEILANESVLDESGYLHPMLIAPSLKYSDVIDLDGPHYSSSSIAGSKHDSENAGWDNLERVAETCIDEFPWSETDGVCDVSVCDPLEKQTEVSQYFLAFLFVAIILFAFIWFLMWPMTVPNVAAVQQVPQAVSNAAVPNVEGRGRYAREGIEYWGEYDSAMEPAILDSPSTIG